MASNEGTNFLNALAQVFRLLGFKTIHICLHWKDSRLFLLLYLCSHEQLLLFEAWERQLVHHESKAVTLGFLLHTLLLHILGYIWCRYNNTIALDDRAPTCLQKSTARDVKTRNKSWWSTCVPRSQWVETVDMKMIPTLAKMPLWTMQWYVVENGRYMWWKTEIWCD